MEQQKAGDNKPAEFSRRERQIMDIIYRLGKATAVEVQNNMDDKLSNSTIRTLLRLLVEKGHLSYKWDGPSYLYMPSVPVEQASKKQLRHIVDTFFNGSVGQVMNALMDISSSDLTEEELDHISSLIEKAKEEEN